jgi:hypothetical protein
LPPIGKLCFTLFTLLVSEIKETSFRSDRFSPFFVRVSNMRHSEKNCYLDHFPEKDALISPGKAETALQIF